MRAAIAVLIALACLILAPAALADTTVSLSFSPDAIAPGGTTTATVTLSDPAPPGGTSVSLAVAPSNAAIAPASVTVPWGETSAQFAVTDLEVSSLWLLSASLLGGNTASGQPSILNPAGHALVNEVEYDEVGVPDDGEFVEVYNPTPSTIDLHHLALAFINGANNAEYLRVPLAAARCLPPASYVVVADDAVTVPPSAGVIRFSAAGDNIQNGSPDGVALVDTGTPSLVDALSYEGSIIAANITGFPGPSNLVEGTALPIATADSNTAIGSLAREPSGTDTGNAQSDWSFEPTPTPGTGGTTGTACEEHAPALDPIGAKSVEAGKTLNFTLSGSDPDTFDVLTYSSTNLPAGASLDPGTGQFTWTPTAAQAGTYPAVHFVAGDGVESDAKDATITVTAPPPVETEPAPVVAPAQPSPPAAPALTRPNTKLGKLRLNRRKRSATFVFSSNVRGSKFLCKLDRKRFARCRSPKTYKHLKPGRHTFQVKATGSAGADATPAIKRFKIKR